MSYLLNLNPAFFSKFEYSNNGLRTYHEELDNNPTLLVTIGDSWTWGDSLDGLHTPEKREWKDSPNRTKLVYGAILKKLIDNCDWINIAWPGTANTWIVDTALQMQLIVKSKKYQRIVVVCTLSDGGRESRQNNDLYLNSGKNLLDFSRDVEARQFDQLASLDESVELIVGRNFTVSFESNVNKIKNHLPLNWMQVNNIHAPIMPEVPTWYFNTYPTRMITKDKQWFDQTAFERSNLVTDYLMASPLHYKLYSKHPTEESHVHWANYIFNYINGSVAESGLLQQS